MRKYKSVLFNPIYVLPSCKPSSKKRFTKRLSRIMPHESKIPKIHSKVSMYFTFIDLIPHPIIKLSEVSSSHDFIKQELTFLFIHRRNHPIF